MRVLRSPLVHEAEYVTVDASPSVRLSPSFLIQPCKSVSPVIGAGVKMHERGRPCEECGASLTCRHRQSEP